jgi:hypothetical protein
LFPVAAFALLGGATGFGNDAVEFAGVTSIHKATWNSGDSTCYSIKRLLGLLASGDLLADMVRRVSARSVAEGMRGVPRPE